MKRTKILTTLAVALLMAVCTGLRAQAQAGGERALQLIRRVESATDQFKRSADAALDRSRLDDSRLEDQVNALIDEFEDVTDRLEDRAENNQATVSDLENVLSRAMRLEMFMQANRLTPKAQTDWAQVRSALNELARPFNVTWVWAVRDNTAMRNVPVRRVVSRLENSADRFRDSFNDALDASRLNGTELEDRANALVTNFERQLDAVEDIVKDDSKRLTANYVELLLERAVAIEAFMRAQNLSPRARRDWERVKANLDELAFVNNVAWVWTITPATTMTAGTTMSAGNDQNPAARDPQGERVGMSGNTAATAATAALARDVRRALLSDLPYYGVFDWIEFDVQPDSTVVLRGQVTAPPDTKSRAEAVVKDVSGVGRVVNQIEVLPPSPNDERLRRSLYQAIYGFDSPLFRYGVGSRQSIHIIVENGRATLKGVVDSEADKQLAHTRARTVSGLFEVNNQLVVDSERRVMVR